MSRRVLGILLAAGLTAGAAEAAPSPFIGKWKLEPSRTRLPDEMTVQAKGGDTYAFDFGGGAETIAVDGRDQPGQDGTLLSVRPQAPDTWIVERKKDGRRLLTATWKLSRDGRTLTDYFRASDGASLDMDYVYRRSGDGRGFAGTWRSIKETVKSPYTMQVRTFEGDGLSFLSSVSHVARNVRVGGGDYPDAGPGAPQGASSSARRLDGRTLEITGRYKGKVTLTEEVGLSTDLKILTITQHIPGRDRPNVFVFRRS